MSDEVLPLRVEVDPRSQVALAQIGDSFSAVEKEMLKIATASPKVQAEVERLTREFTRGSATAQQTRAALLGLAGDIPKSAQELRKAADASERFTQKLAEMQARSNARAWSQQQQAALRDYQAELAKTERALQKVTEKNRELSGLSGLRDFAHHARGYLGEVREAAEAAAAAVEHVATRTAERQRLRRISGELSLDLGQAQAQSDRFVSQLDVAGLSEHFASAGVRLTQEQAGALTRGGARLAQMNGTSFEMQGGRIFSGIVGGELEVLRRFGPEMAALSGQAHTAQERLAAFVHVVEGLGRPTEDAATAVERFKESVAQAERAFFGNFTAEMVRVAGRGGPFGEANDRLEDLQRSLLGIHSASSLFEQSGTTVGRIFGLWASSIRLATNALNTFYSGVVRVAVLNPARVVNSLTGGRLGALAQRVAGTPEEETTAPTQGSAASDMTFGDSQRELDDLAARQLAEDRLEMAQAATRKENNPTDPHAGWHPRHTGGGRGRRPITIAEMNRAIERKRETFAQAESDRVMRRAGLIGDSTNQSLAEELGLRTLGPGEHGITVLGEAERIANDAGKTQAQREVDEAAQRVERQRDFTSIMVGLYGEQANAAQGAAESISGAFTALGSAYSKHLESFIAGKEDFADAVQGMVSDTISAIGKEAGVRAGMEFAAGLGTAIWNPAESGMHFASAVAYTGVAALAGAAGIATQTAGQQAAASKGEHHAANDNARSTRDLSFGARGGATAEAGPRIYQFYAPYIDGRFATRDQVGEELGIYTDAADRERRVGRRRAA